jgi:hypothetical protein
MTTDLDDRLRVLVAAMLDEAPELQSLSEWRALQRAKPGERVNARHRRHRTRRAYVAAAILLVVVIGGAVVVATRSGGNAPSIQSPAGPTPTDPDTSGSPRIGAVPIFLPINASDWYSAFDLGAVAAVRDPDGSTPPCNMSQLPPAMYHTHIQYFEDPGWYRGSPAASTISAPPAPQTPPSCTPQAAAAVARIEESLTAMGATLMGWTQKIQDLEADPAIATARAAEITCIQSHGIDSVSNDGFINDGWFIEHPDQRQQANQIFADCITPVVAARQEVRTRERNTFVADNSRKVQDLQQALDDYLHAIYAPSP